jgi:hypothetical protein
MDEQALLQEFDEKLKELKLHIDGLRAKADLSYAKAELTGLTEDHRQAFMDEMQVVGLMFCMAVQWNMEPPGWKRICSDRPTFAMV